MSKQTFSGDEMMAIRAVYIAAMLDGYAGGESKKSVKTKTPDGHITAFVYTDGDYQVIDRYEVTPVSEYTRGATTIFCKDVPVWRMTYEGHYPKEVIPFLKEALKKAYEHGEFWGGRGPFRFRLGSREYRNLVDQQGCFEKFSGREIIVVGEKEVGHHDFKGGFI